MKKLILIALLALGIASTAVAGQSALCNSMGDFGREVLALRYRGVSKATVKEIAKANTTAKALPILYRIIEEAYVYKVNLENPTYECIMFGLQLKATCEGANL